MVRKYGLPIFFSTLLIIILYIVHQLVFLALGFSNETMNFQFSLNFVYLFFGIGAIVLMLVLLIVKSKSMDNLGMVFMILTSLKMGITFFIFRPITHPVLPYSKIEKPNFLIVFALFLILETLFGIWLLNKKEA